MSDNKKSDGAVTLLNRGQRSYDLTNGADGKARRHGPGATMTYSAEEAKRMEGYKELVDITKLPGQVDVAALKAENAKLLAENTGLKAQLQALQDTIAAPKQEETHEPKRKPRQE